MLRIYSHWGTSAVLSLRLFFSNRRLSGLLSRPNSRIRSLSSSHGSMELATGDSSSPCKASLGDGDQVTVGNGGGGCAADDDDQFLPALLFVSVKSCTALLMASAYYMDSENTSTSYGVQSITFSWD